MFKFFRQYNKVLLIIGVSLLMFVFLIQGTLGTGGRGNTAASVVIGTVKGEKVTAAERVEAAAQLAVLHAYFPGLDRYLGDPNTRALKWLLIKREAKSYGLYASRSQIDMLLRQAKITDDANGLADAAAKLETTTDVVRESFRAMAVFMDYEQLVSGKGLRLAPVEIDHVLADLTARAKVKVVLMTAQRNLPNATEPDEKTVQALFEKYKNDLAGKSEPFGIGFMIPNRAKIEFLCVPGDQVKAKISVDEVEALAFYDAKKEYFVEQAPEGQTQPAEPKIKPYDAVAPMIRQVLKRQKADALADRIIRTAAGLLAADASGLAETNGYKVLPEGFKPTPLSQIAQKIQQQFGILPEVVRLEDRWLDKAGVSQDARLGHLTVQGQQGSAADYLFSAKEFVQGEDRPFASLRFQAHLPSQPLASFDGSRYIVRLVDAEGARVPKSLDEVRADVVNQAKLLSSYQQLVQSRDQWLTRFNQPVAVDLSKNSTLDSTEAFANDLKLKVVAPPPFARRDFGKPGAPVTQIDGVGNDPAFVGKVFDLVDTLAAQGGVDSATPQQRSFAVPLDSTMTLALVRVQSVEPMARSTFEMLRSNQQMAMRMQQILFGDENKAISLTAIAKRVGYVDKNGEAVTEKPMNSPQLPAESDDQGM